MEIFGALFGLIVIGWVFVLPIYLSSQVAALKKRLDALEEEPGLVTDVLPEPPSSQPETPPIPSPPETSVPESVSPQPTPSEAVDWESLMGRKWLYWAGILVILLGVGFFLKYAFDNGWFNEATRMIIGLAAGVLFIMVGERLKAAYRYFALGLYGTGIGILYLSLYTGYNFYHLLPYGASFFVMVLVTALAVVLAIKNDSLFLAFVSLLGGFLTPLILHREVSSLYGFFSYLFLLNAGIFTLTLFKRWSSLAGVGLAMTALLLCIWTGHTFTPELFIPATLFLLAFFLLFLAIPVTHALRTGSEEVDFFLVAANGVFVTCFLADFLNTCHPEFKGFSAVFLSCVYLGAGLFVRRGRPNEDNLILTFLGVALVFLTIAVPLQLHGFPVAMVWAGEAVVLSWMGVRIPSQSARLAAFALFVAAMVDLVFCESLISVSGYVPILNQRVFSYAFVAGAIFLSAFIIARGRPVVTAEEHFLSTMFTVIAQILLFGLITSENHYFFARGAAAGYDPCAGAASRETMALTLVWACYAGLLMIVGMVKNLRSFRYCALALFALTILKVFLVDIASVELIYRIGGFLLLGIVLLLVSFAYHRKQERSRASESPADTT